MGRHAGADGGLLAVLPEMVRAGVLELRECYFGEDLGEVAENVYRAMEHARGDQSVKLAASSSTPSR